MPPKFCGVSTPFLNRELHGRGRMKYLVGGEHVELFGTSSRLISEIIGCVAPAQLFGGGAPPIEDFL